jgi:Transposase
VRNWIGFRREAVHTLRRCCSAAWIIDRPPALLSPRRGESQVARACIQGRRERCTGSGSRSQSNPVLLAVHTFAGIDVSGRELSVALRCGQGDDKPAVARFPNSPSGHKALVAYLLRGGGRVRVCLEASGNYSLDLALTLQAHRQVEISVINPRRARRSRNRSVSAARRIRSMPVCSANLLLVCLGFVGDRPAPSPSTCGH